MGRNHLDDATLETMNYDTTLPPEIRARFKTGLGKPKRLKLWHKVALCIVLLAGLRHLNTVPQRERVSEFVTIDLDHPEIPYDQNGGIDFRPRHRATHVRRVYTAEDIFGSIYREQMDGKDTGNQSKIWEDFFPKR